MPDTRLRPYTPADKPGCAALWEQVFGDPAPLAERFLSLFEHQPGFGQVAQIDGQIAAAAYSVPGLTILRPGRPDLPARYLYAVATHPAYRSRGLAAMLCRTLRDQAFAEGSLLLTKPAEDSLYPWYANKISAIPTMPCRRLTVTGPAVAARPVTPLTPGEYNVRREACLRRRPHVRLPDALLTWEHLLHAHYGGGFYAVGPALADVYAGSTLEIAELLSPAPEADARALLAHLNLPAATVTLPGDTKAYISCASPSALPDDLGTVWFGPVFG